METNKIKKYIIKNIYGKVLRVNGQKKDAKKALNIEERRKTVTNNGVNIYGWRKKKGLMMFHVSALRRHDSN